MIEEIKDFEIDDATMTAGDILRAARTTGRRKREIQTISKQLCIREEFLQALEDGNYNVLPETVYILGFARNYAMELGLDPDMIVDKIKKEMGINIPSDLMPVAPRDKVDAPKEPEHIKFGKKFDVIKQSKFGKFMVSHWKLIAGIFVAVLVLIIGLLIILPSDKVAVEDVIVTDVAPVQVVNPEPEYKQPVRERFGTENKEETKIILQATKESWVKIEDGRGKTVFSRVLVPGDVYYVPTGNKHKATFGNAGGMDVWVNGTLAPKVGADNARKTGILLDADSLMGVKKAATTATK